MNRLLNKVAIVTGAAGGIGKAIAILFAQEGAMVLATDKQEDVLHAWVGETQKKGLKIAYAAHNVALKPSWEEVVAEAINHFGKIDILINNAGIYPPGATTLNTTEEQWNNVLSVNLSGPFWGTQACVPEMINAGGGAIVHISSIAGIVGGNGPAYTASKGGLRLLAKDQAVELAKHNIRVNSIHPGGVITPMTDFLTQNSDAQQVIKNLCPMERMGSAEEIALGALYLASSESSYTTGTELVIDGGLIAR